MSDWLAKETMSRHRINHLAGAGLLFHFAVLPERNLQIARFNLGINKWSDRRVGIEGFARENCFSDFCKSRSLMSSRNRVTENIFKRVLSGDVLRGRPDDNRELGFEIGFMLRKRDLDSAVRVEAKSLAL